MFIINVNRLIKILYKLIFIYNYLKKVLQNQKKLFIFVQRIWIMKRVSAGLISVFGLFLLSCSTLESDSVEVSPKALKLNFDISVLRDGVKISEDNGAVTKSAGDSSASVSINVPYVILALLSAGHPVRPNEPSVNIGSKNNNFFISANNIQRIFVRCKDDNNCLLFP